MLHPNVIQYFGEIACESPVVEMLYTLRWRGLQLQLTIDKLMNELLDISDHIGTTDT